MKSEASFLSLVGLAAQSVSHSFWWSKKNYFFVRKTFFCVFVSLLCSIFGRAPKKLMTTRKQN
jgi:hypothetical protein